MKSNWRRELSQRDGGFTLVELMVAMMVIASVLMLLIGVQIQASATIKDARLRQQATALANEAIEQMRAMPWSIIDRGMHPDFDGKYVVGNVLSIDGEVFTIRVADASSYSPGDSWIPLFDSSGSNVQHRFDPGGTGTEFTVRAYVTEPTIGDQGVGLLAIVEWMDTRGRDQHTLIHAPNFAAMECATGETQNPYAGSCQEMLSASASSGPIIAKLTSWSVDALTSETTQATLIPGTSHWSVEMSTAAAAASVVSEQTTTAEARSTYGGTTRLTGPLASDAEADTRSVGRYILASSNNPPTPDALPANPPNQSISHAITAEDTRTVSGAGLEIRARSDFGRPSLLKSSVTTSCRSGVPAGAPCAHAEVNNLASDTSGAYAAGYVTIRLDSGETLRLVRRLNESGGNTESAWAARFAQAAGTSGVGCTALTGAGCSSAGADRSLGTVAFGTVLDGGPWDHGNQHLAVVTNLVESVRVERGANGTQKTSLGTATRTGSISFWDGTQWRTVTLDANTNGTYMIGPSTYVSGTPGYSIEVLTGTITVSGMYNELVGSDADCLLSACQVTTSGGEVAISYDFLVRTPAYPDGLRYEFSSVINPVRAMAVYKGVDS